MLTETETRLAEFRVVPFDDIAGEHLARLKRVKAVRNVGLADFLIACIALAQDATLVTRNTKDFQPIPNLKLTNWVD
jgi:tRNA(fMet)-specific endonuclease VapC